jgi:hypothetical protein
MMSDPASSMLVSFGGHTLCVRFDSLKVAAAFQTHLRHCPVQTDDVPIAEFHVTAVESAFTISVDGGGLFSNLNFDLTLQALLTEVISRLVAVCDRGLVIHAATLAQDGNAVILSAQGGSGKSTLAAWLTADGFQYLTDEVIEIPLRPPEKASGQCERSRRTAFASTTLSANTFPRSIFLKQGSAFVWQQRLSQTESSHFLRFSDDAAWIDPQLFNPALPASQATPRLLVFPRYVVGSPLQSQKLTPGETLFRILQNVTNARNLPRHGLDAASRLAQQVTAYNLVYSDLEQASDWIRDSLNR